jgi:hypothetical protein
MPDRPVSDLEARSIAERQAARFLLLSGITEPHVPGSIIAGLPRVAIEVRPGLPQSGVTFWDNRAKLWRIWLRAHDAPVRQRFSLAHELKHVIDNDVIAFAYPALGTRSSRQRAELICDYFAACLLMPRPWIKRAWVSGVQQLDDLADLFGVSTEAMARRLSDLGLRESPYRNVYFRSGERPVPTEASMVYFRSAHRPTVGVAA